MFLQNRRSFTRMFKYIENSAVGKSGIMSLLHRNIMANGKIPKCPNRKCGKVTYIAEEGFACTCGKIIKMGKEFIKEFKRKWK